MDRKYHYYSPPPWRVARPRPLAVGRRLLPDVCPVAGSGERLFNNQLAGRRLPGMARYKHIAHPNQGGTMIRLLRIRIGHIQELIDAARYRAGFGFIVHEYCTQGGSYAGSQN